MLSITQINKTVSEYIDSLQITGSPQGLYEPIRYSIDGGGKRLRPALTVAACNIFSDNPLASLPAAAAVEIFHNFTLLHDDIMDHGTVRRGKPTVYNRWGENVAILSGDAMMICSYRLLQQTPAEYMPSVLSCFNYMALTVCEGQQLDMEFEERERVSIEEYMGMIDKKTAALFSGAVLLGATVGGADADCLHSLYRFATELGLVFQLQDDYLDSYGDLSKLGKPIGGDIIEGKKTFLTVTAIDRADEPMRHKLQLLLADKQIDPTEKIASVLEIYKSLEVERTINDEIELHLRKSTEALESILSDRIGSERIAALKDLSLGLVNRNR